MSNFLSSIYTNKIKFIIRFIEITNQGIQYASKKQQILINKNVLNNVELGYFSGGN